MLSHQVKIETSSVEREGGGTSSKNTALVKPQVVGAARTMRLREVGGEGRTNLKKARRHFSHGISWCVDLITKPVKTDKDQT